MVNKNISVKLLRTELPSLHFVWLSGLLVILFLMGGSSREDVQSLAIMYPITIVSCGACLLNLKMNYIYDKKSMFLVIVLICFIFLLYLFPFPEHFLGNLEYLNKIAAIGQQTGIRDAPHLLTIAPLATWNSVVFLFVPLSVLLVALRLSRAELLLTLPVAMLLATASGAMGMMQLIGSADGPLYLYRITNNGNAVGLFANRNHAAVFLACLFPMIAMFAARSQVKNPSGRITGQLTAVAIAIILVPLILVTGSRSGLFAAAIGVVGGILVYWSHVPAGRGSEKRKYLASISVISALASLVFVTIYFSRAEAINRVLAESTSEYGRAEFWAASLKLFWQYFPFGFGPGSFVPAFQYDEPTRFLNGPYLNRLHNDWLETALTFGVPGILFLMCAITYYVRRTYLLWVRMDGKHTGVAIGRMASVIFAIFGVASISDYPLRTPALMGFSVLVFAWFIETTRDANRTY